MPNASPAAQWLLEAGKRAFPELVVALAHIEEFVRVRGIDDAVDLASLHGADLFLACACALGDARALATFDSRHLVEVPLFLRGVERSEAVSEEVKQLVRERLFVGGVTGARPKILEYSGRGPLGSWLRVVTLRVAANRRRQDKRHAPLQENDAVDVLPTIDPELAIVRARYKREFNDALRESFAALGTRERLVFRMHFVDGLNIERIGAVFQVHRATVARWLAAGRTRLLERTLELLGQRLRVPPAELESLLQVVRSTLDLSLRGLLVDEEA